MVPANPPAVTGRGVPTWVGVAGPCARDSRGRTVCGVRSDDLEGTPVTVSAPSAPASSLGSPLTVRAGAALLALTAAASTVGVVMFGLVWTDDPLGAATVFVAFMIATAVTAVAAIPSLLRGSALGWGITLGWASCYTYWSVYKVFAEEEFQSAGFLAAGIGVIALLVSRSARAHAGVTR